MKDSKITPEDQFAEFIKAGTKSTEALMESFPSLMNLTADLFNVNKSVLKNATDLENEENWKKVQEEYVEFFSKQLSLWQRFGASSDKSDVEPVITPQKTDRRFSAVEWNDNSGFDFIKQSYLLMSELLMNLSDSVDIEPEAKEKLQFYTRQYIDAISPSNFAFTNPEVMKLAKETNGESLVDGYKNFMKDFKQGYISQTDESAFEIGRNIAITPGTVVFENEIIQLIQYSPATKQVNQFPLLIIPPCINKFYILDLQPHNSFVKYSVAQGNTVFLISWVNPMKGTESVAIDGYILDGIFAAVDAVRSITKAKKVNALGYCIGGTLLSIAAAIYRKKKRNPFNSLTFLASLIDFSDIGPMSVFVDEQWIALLERELHKEGVLDGKKLASSFNLLRPNDLIWSYVVNNYLKGQDPKPFDILYWNGDSTNLPGKMYAYYLRNMCLENKLKDKNALTIGGTSIDLGMIDNDTYVLGCKEDHISPLPTIFTTTELISGKCQFVLSGSGHVAGVVNPPEKSKRGYLTEGELGKGMDLWLETAKQNEGSWWPHWSAWLDEVSVKKIPTQYNIGNGEFVPIEPAPGRYVKVSIK